MAAEWEGCEDCMSSGGHRDMYGEGTCGVCGGTGRRPANEEAWDVVRRREQARQDAIYAQIQREMDFGPGW